MTPSPASGAPTHDTSSRNTVPPAAGSGRSTCAPNARSTPARLLERIEDLRGGRVRGRGAFWVPARPDSVCVWDGSGGQVSIGGLGAWGAVQPQTRLVMTGTGDEQTALREAFQAALLTPGEWHAGLAPWLGSADVLAPWLGEPNQA